MAKQRTNKLPVDKIFFDLSGGLHTESSPLAFPPEVTLDEENFEILTDGTRRRRRGLSYETGNDPEPLFEKYEAAYGTQIYTWRNVNNNPDKTYIVIQLGSYLYFYEDGETIGNKKHAYHVDLGFYVTDQEEDDTLVKTAVSFTHGRGRLFVSHRTMEPLSIEYTSDTTEFLVKTINIRVRAFEDIEDGIDLREFPSTETSGANPQGVSASTVVQDCPNTHEFNLRNRGWLFGDDELGANNYVRQYSKWPSKQMIPYYGYYASPQVLQSDGKTYVTTNDDAERGPDEFGSGFVTDAEKGATLTSGGGGGGGWHNLGHVKKWSSEKIEKEIFGNAYVPRGSFIISIWDNEYPEGVAAKTYNRNEPYDTTPIVAEYNAGTESIRYTITMTSELPSDLAIGHTVSTSEFALEHVFYEGAYPNSGSDPNTPVITYRKSFKVVAFDPTAKTISIDAKVFLGDEGNGRNMSEYFKKFRETGRTTGEAVWAFENSGHFKLHKEGDQVMVDDGSGTLVSTTITAATANPGLSQTDVRPSSNAWFAGRLFQAGMQTKQWSDMIFFSKTILNDEEFGQCFQGADPTHPDLNALISSDGGTIQIPNIGNIIDMQPMESSLLVFSDQGVWEVSGSSFFAANDIRVRQITSAEAISASAIIKIDNGIIYASHRGIYALSRVQAGAIQSQNIIEKNIQTYWNELSYAQQKNASLSFDESKGRVYIAHNNNTSNHKVNTVMVLDLRLGSFFKYRFAPATSAAYIVGIHSTDQSSQPDEFQKMKFFIVNDYGTALQIADFSQETFEDFDGVEHIPFLLTGYDNLSDFSRQRYSPTIHTFMKKTETGYTETGTVGESSLTVQPRWDFTDRSSANKFGREQQVYRHKRAYVPSGSSDSYADGYDLVVARTKIRGRGKALQLKFTGEAGKDAHLLGWSLHYEGTAEI